MLDLNELKRQTAEVSGEAKALYAQLRIDSREEKLAELVARTEEADLWDDPESAQKLMADVGSRRNSLASWRKLISMADDAVLMAEMAEEADDQETAREAEQLVNDVRALLERLNTEVLFADPLDTSSAIIEINAGAGGTEACDWAAMLGRMYLRWAERKGFQADIIDQLDGDQAGVKSMTIEITGEFIYGYLKSERGAHRLIRFSPFNSKGSRETSFASVSVIPDVGDDVDIDLKEEDLKIDTYRASGAGGQHVNKTESAIRITHLPTNTVVTCQNERSQQKNRVSALRVLKARLLQRQREEQEAAMAKLQGVKTDIAFGNQIRTYFLQPYTLVKDHRTDYETGNANAVLDGDLDSFMIAYLRQLADARVAVAE
ncbi:MAG: peptide chain release factor 2 [bacterium]